jgi:peptidoglycan/xylan/chitin deacetylase (PgdA/CDA1 family)
VFQHGPDSILRKGKLATLTVARALGAHALLMESSWRRNRLLILCYHGTSLDDEHEWSPATYVTPKHLRRRMELIREARCNVLPLEEGLRRLYEGSLPPRSVAITYDDGPYDFYSEAYPVLRSFGFPVTVYLTTYYARFQHPVYDPMCSYLLWKGRGRAVRWPEAWGSGEAMEISGVGLRAAAERLRRYPAERGMSGLEKDALLTKLAELVEVDYEAILRRRMLHIMTLEEARELVGQGVDFQLHTHRHRVSRDKARFEREVAENRKWLAGIRGGEAAHFCYPSGVYRPEFPGWLREWKIASAVTTEAGMASTRSEAMRLPRLLDSSTMTETEFMAWLSGISDMFPQRRVEEPPGQFIEDRLDLGKEEVA